MSHLENVIQHNSESQAMNLIIKPSPAPFFLPTSTPPSSSFSQPPLQFTQAGQPKQNYQLPAQYQDFNPEPLWPLEEEDEQLPTVALPRLCLIVHNRLRTATNFFGLLREYLYRPSFDPYFFVPERDLH